MEQKQITYETLLEVNFFLSEVLLKKVDITNPSKNKFTWALFKLSENIRQPLEEYNKKRSEIFIKFASVDKEENILYEDIERGIFKYKIENIKKRDTELDALLKKPCFIDTYIYQNNEYIKKNYGFTIKTLNGILFNIDDFNEPENDIEEEAPKQLQEAEK